MGRTSQALSGDTTAISETLQRHFKDLVDVCQSKSMKVIIGKKKVVVMSVLQILTGAVMMCEEQKSMNLNELIFT